MKITACKLGKYFLVHQTMSTTEALPYSNKRAVNHVVVLDCSGSMTCDLPKLRENLKARLPQLIGEDDTLSLVWFSGRSEFGVIVEALKVSTLKDLASVNKIIDRWLRPIGMTGFVEPIAEVSKLIERVKKNNTNVFSLFFMSDGCDNQFSQSQILSELTKLDGQLASATFVEYGYYADRQLLSKMAETVGGTHIHSDSFESYEPVFTKALSQTGLSPVKQITVELQAQPIGDFVFYIHNNEVITHSAKESRATINDGTQDIFYVCSEIMHAGVGVSDSSLYAALGLYAVRMKSDVVMEILRYTGDVKFIDMFASCFGKQKYSEFVKAVYAAAFSPDCRYTQGQDYNRVPADNATTLLDVLDILVKSDAYVLLDHPAFQYNRISRGTLSADENLSAAEQDTIRDIQAKMSTEKNAKKLKAYQAQIDDILNTKKDALVFEPKAMPGGYSISSLTYNEERPNVSILVRKAGTVNLSSRADTAPTGSPAFMSLMKSEGAVIHTFIYRNYAIIKDGLVNVDKLPVRVDQTTQLMLTASGVKMEPLFSEKADEWLLDFKNLPIVNRKMVKDVSAEEMAKLEFSLIKAQARAKVIKHIRNERYPDVKIEGWKSVYGDEATHWLAEQGLTEYKGYSPKTVQAPAKDVYRGKALEVKLAGYSALPPVDKVREMLRDSKALNGPSTLMAEAIKDVETWLFKNPEKLHKNWLTELEKVEVSNVRSLQFQAALIRFSIIVGQTWFQEFSSLEENTYSCVCDKTKVKATFVLSEVDIPI